jgi:hypothetical protein
VSSKDEVVAIRPRIGYTVNGNREFIQLVLAILTADEDVRYQLTRVTPPRSIYDPTDRICRCLEYGLARRPRQGPIASFTCPVCGDEWWAVVLEGKQAWCSSPST